MKRYSVTLLQVGLLSGSRAIASAGLAFLLAGKMGVDHRKAAGWSLLGAGSVMYLTLVADMMLRDREPGKSRKAD